MLPLPALWHLLQLSDQFFPTGAYAFSHALETYVAAGQLRDRGTCSALLRQLGHNALLPCDLVFCRHAFRRAAAADLEGVVALDQRLHAMKVPRELRQESQHTGQALLQAALVLAPAPLLAELAQRQRQGTAPGHHAVVFGAVTHALGIPEAAALVAYLYSASAALVAAAVRLVPLGQRDGQRLLAELAPELLAALPESETLTPEEAWSAVPGLEIRSMQHERLYSRLCRS